MLARLTVLLRRVRLETMLGVLYRRGLPVVVWFAACACAGRADEFGETYAEPADTGSASDGSDSDLPPVKPPDDGLSGDLPLPEARRVIADAAGIEACSYHATEDRVAFHYRDGESSTCLDVILIRVSKGGVTPEGLGLPWDWGVGHISSYPCTSDGQIASFSAPTTIRDVTGNIGMGGGLVGLPEALALDLTLAAPIVGADAHVSYVLQAFDLDVTRACDDSTQWALQPLGLQGEVTPSDLRGCSYIGAYDRVTFQHREPTTGTCSSLTLIAYDETGYLPEGLSLPANWSVEYMDSYGCSQDGTALTGEYSFTDAVGEVIFGGALRGMPEYAWLDVTLSASEEGSRSPFDPPAEPVPAPQRLLGADAVDVSHGCSAPRTW